MTPSGIEPATFRLVAQYLYQLRHCVPLEVTGVRRKKRTLEFCTVYSSSAPVRTGPGAHTSSCTIGTGSFLGVKNGRGVTLTPHPLLVPWSRKGRVIPLLPLWAKRPVQSLSACTRVQFTFTFTTHQLLFG